MGLLLGIRNWSWKRLLLLASIILGVAAGCTSGYFHPDEHFQILEFANWKMGYTPEQELAWEFKDRIRPALQPTIAYLNFSFWEQIGMYDPFFQVACLRFLSAALMLGLMYRLSSTLDFPPRDQKLFFASCLLLWFGPMLGVRFSSENWAALAFLGASWILLAGKTSRFSWFGVGFLLGIAFDIRFQMAFSILGLGAWFIWIKKPTAATWVFLLLGGLLGIGIGMGVDRWFYNEWVCTPWNYFTRNILEHKAREYGVEPWWYYLPIGLVKLLPPVSLWVIVGLFRGLYLKRSHLFTWAFVPFFIGHSLVAHKELRFMFPMMIPVLYLAYSGWKDLAQHAWNSRAFRRLFRFSLLINGLAWFFFCTQPLQAFMPYFRHLYLKANEGPLKIISEKESIYKLVDVHSFVYNHPDIEEEIISRIDTLHHVAHRGDYFVHRRLRLQGDAPKILMKSAYCYWPDWVSALNFNHWQERSHMWRIYEITEAECR